MSEKIIKRKTYFVITLMVILLFLFFYWSSLKPNDYKDSKSINESLLIIRNSSIDFRQSIDILGLNNSDFSQDKIYLRTINAYCNLSDPDCYSNSSPFIYKSNGDKIKIMALRLEEANLINPSLKYFQNKVQGPDSANTLYDLEFSVIDYPFYGKKTNLFFNLELEQNETYCFQVIDSLRKSDIICQNFKLSPISFESLKISLFGTQENTSNNSLLVIEFPDVGKEEILRFLNSSELKLSWPVNFKEPDVHYKNFELINNLKYCNNRYYVTISTNIDTFKLDLFYKNIDEKAGASPEFKVLMIANIGSFMNIVSLESMCNNNYNC